MKKNLYFRQVIKRQNFAQSFINNVLFTFSSVPRFLLEVFIRTNLGERYFSFGLGIFLAFILAVFPITIGQTFIGYENHDWKFILHYLTWYVFIAAFLFYCWKRRNEVKRNPSVFDFERYSLSAGSIMGYFVQMGTIDGNVNYRKIETFYEPAYFFIAGLLLFLLGQYIGIVIFWSSIFYSLSYFCAYKMGDDFVMDKIDEMILNEEMENAFVQDKNAEESRGVQFYMKKPNDISNRQKLVPSIVEDEIIVDAK